MPVLKHSIKKKLETTILISSWKKARKPTNEPNKYE